LTKKKEEEKEEGRGTGEYMKTLHVKSSGR